MPVNDGLLNYVREASKRGISQDEIHKNLLAVGWQAAAIQEAVAVVSSGVVQPAPGIALAPSGVPAQAQPIPANAAAMIPSTGFSFSSFEKYYVWAGLGGILLSAIIFFGYYNHVLPAPLAIGIAAFELVLGLLASLVLFGLTRLFKIENHSLGKALVFTGAVGLALALELLLTLVHTPLVITGLLSLLTYIGSFWLLARLYVLPIGRSIKLGISNTILTAIIGIIIAGVCLVAGLFKVASLFGNSSPIAPLETQSTSQNNPLDANALEQPDNRISSPVTTTAAPSVPAVVFTGKEVGIKNCGDAIIDRDGFSYKTVKIGPQCWLAENLKTKTKPDGILLTNLADEAERDCIASSNTRGTEADCQAGYALYTWRAAMNNATSEGAQGICPTGWHIPKDAEMNILDQLVSDKKVPCDPNRSEISAKNCDPGAKALRAGGPSGFNWLLAGFYGEFREKRFFAEYGEYGYIWSSSFSPEKDFFTGSDLAWARRITSPGYELSDSIDRKALNDHIKASVRCLKNS